MSHPKLQQLIERAAILRPMPAAIVYPCSATALEAVDLARAQNLLTPILLGPKGKIEAEAERIGFDLAGVEIRDTGEDPIAAAERGVQLCRDGVVGYLVKGSLHSDELLGVVVRRESGLRSSRRVTHAFVFDAPGYDKLLLMADCVINIMPDLAMKRDIVQNAVDLARTLGVVRPEVAVLAAVEVVNPGMPATIDAAALSKMAERGQIQNAHVDGPLAFDVAISPAAATIKGLGSRNAPDILIVPNIDAGNMLYKQMIYFGKAECAGVVLGAKVPIVLTSRADSATTRVASCALARLMIETRTLA